MREAGDPSSESIMSQRLEDLGLRLVSERPAASGAGTDVYRATASSPWEREGRRVNDVALQVLKRRDELPGTWDDHRRRFLYERATLARVQASPHVLALFEEGTWDGRPAMVVEWCKAGRLKTWLEALPTAPSLVRQLSLQLLDALADAHAGGVIHRGIRPDAVLLRTGRDIALAYFVEPDEDELGSVYEGVAGSRRYMAPEQFDEPDRVSPSTDVFSAACLIFEMATGHHPFDHLVDGDGLHALSPYAGDARPRLEPLADVPSGAALAPVLAPALQVDPGSRLDSVELLRRRLAESAYGAEAQVTEAVEHIGLAAATGSAPQRHHEGPFRLCADDGTAVRVMIESAVPLSKITPPLDAMVVGRHPSCHVVVEHGEISAAHVLVKASDGGQVLLADLHSSNGSFAGVPMSTRAPAPLTRVIAQPPVNVTLGRYADVTLRIEADRDV